MAKREAESINSLSVFWLKKHGYLNKDESYHSGGIKWTYGWAVRENSINFSVIKNNCGAPQQTSSIELRYTCTDNYTGEKTEINYKMELATTRCNYGGVRYWFICPLIKGSQYCGRRVGVIYSGAENYFGCRKCANITYAAQMKGGRFRRGSVTIPDIEKLEKEIKRYYYKGKPTRKHRRLMRMNNSLERDFIMLAARLEK